MPETEVFLESRALYILWGDHMEFGEGLSDGILASEPQWKKQIEPRAGLLYFWG